MTMEPDDDDLKKFFERVDASVPAPDAERKKETLNLATAAFEAQKSAILKNNSNTAQGSSWWVRLTSQINPERKDNMNISNKKMVYGGIFGGLATACVALMIYHGPASLTGALERTETLAVIEEMPEEQQLASADTAITSHELKRESADEGAAVSPQPAPPPMVMAENEARIDDALANAQSVAPPLAEMSAAKRAAPAGAAMNSLSYAPEMMPMPVPQQVGRDNFERVDENSIIQVKQEPVSTFSIDVDTASYAFARQSLDNGILPQKDSVRVEEMINYFDYDYAGPSSKDEPFKANIALKDSPWNEGKKIMAIGIKGFDVEKTAMPDSNLVFLLDTSGSMNEPKKLPLLKQSLSLLLDTLKPTDTVSIVTYAGSAGVVLPPTEVSKKGEILASLQNLAAGGSTAGGEGIRLAYQQAQSNFKKDAVNRVILATDGDFNVGITSPDELQDFIEREREKGIFLSVLGFGTGNYNDALMQKLAQNGNGVAAYIDTLNEARKVLVQEAGATLFPIAKDVKIQVEFNPAQVSEYRLVGYETRALKTEDFNNDKVDAGDIGAGAEVTAIYEITPAGAAPSVDASRYAAAEKDNAAAKGSVSDELAFVKIRYKLPRENASKLITTPVTDAAAKVDPALAREAGWAEAVAGFAQLLKGGAHTGGLTYDDVLKQAEANKGADPYGYRAEFITLVHKAKTAASMSSSPAGHGPGYGE